MSATTNHTEPTERRKRLMEAQRQAASRLAQAVRETRTSHLDTMIASVPSWMDGAK